MRNTSGNGKNALTNSIILTFTSSDRFTAIAKKNKFKAKKNNQFMLKNMS